MTERIVPSPLSISLRDVNNQFRRLQEIDRHEGASDSEYQQLMDKFRERNGLIVDAILNGGAKDIDLKVYVDLIGQTSVVVNIRSGIQMEIRVLESALRRPGVIDTKEQLLARLRKTNEPSSQ